MRRFRSKITIFVARLAEWERHLGLNSSQQRQTAAQRRAEEATAVSSLREPCIIPRRERRWRRTLCRRYQLLPEKRLAAVETKRLGYHCFAAADDVQTDPLPRPPFARAQWPAA